MTIKAKVICDSVNEQGNRLTTFELEYPRIIHSEFMTHRMISRNAASSRAIPFDKMLQQLEGIPSRFGAAQKGMQDNGEEYTALINNGGSLDLPKEVWSQAKQSAVYFSKAFKEAGYHKQVFNRLTEPFQMIKVVASATEWDNFFWLRDDVMADPTIAELARKMKEAYEASTPQLLKAGELHLPYVDKFTYYTNPSSESDFSFCIFEDGKCIPISTEQAIKVSAARCAAVSFRNEDYGLEKSEEVYARLVGDERKHSSALEHQATPIAKTVENIGTHMKQSDWVNVKSDPPSWQKGISHIDRKKRFWSGNFCGWIQHRKTIDGENKETLPHKKGNVC